MLNHEFPCEVVLDLRSTYSSGAKVNSPRCTCKPPL